MKNVNFPDSKLSLEFFQARSLDLNEKKGAQNGLAFTKQFSLMFFYVRQTTSTLKKKPSFILYYE